jgi:hypothetical protein
MAGYMLGPEANIKGTGLIILGWIQQHIAVQGTEVCNFK